MKKSNNQNSLAFQHYFLVGIKGVGMAALASCLLDLGKSVSGWDVPEAFVTQPMLDRLKIHITDSFELPENIEALIFTAAHQDAQHPLVKRALQRHIPCFSLADISGELTKLKPTIAVCGVGGKSTTSAMLAWIMSQYQPDASYLVGVGEIIGLPKTGAWSEKSSTFTIEADEYATNPSQVAQGLPPQPRFLSLSPTTIICTQILHDHPDVYPTLEDTRQIFRQFFQILPNSGTIIINEVDQVAKEIVTQLLETKPQISVVTIGFNETADVCLKDIKSIQGKTSALVLAPSLSPSPFELKIKVPGTYNLWNAAAALAAAAHHSIPLHTSLAALASFSSTSRRLELKAQTTATLYYDDYAHHPFEIAAAIQALRDWYPNKTICVFFQPHTFSRTETLLSDFAASLSQADRVVVLPIFASARESNETTISSQDLANQISAMNTSVSVCLSLEEGRSLLARSNENIVVTMGAGDVYKLHPWSPMII